MKDLQIRAFQLSDFEYYARTLLLTLPCDDLDDARENAKIIMERIEKDDRELWVAETGGVPVGFMVLEFQVEDKNIEIDWFDIHPDYQKHGVGATLVQKAEERAQERRYQTLTIHTASSNHEMRGFAKKNGFEEIELLSDFWGEGYGNAYLLQKKLD